MKKSNKIVVKEHRKHNTINQEQNRYLKNLIKGFNKIQKIKRKNNHQIIIKNQLNQLNLVKKEIFELIICSCAHLEIIIN